MKTIEGEKMKEFLHMRGPLAEKQLFIFDMDGTLYLGEKVFDGARRFILSLRRAGKRVLFFTNNASHNHEFYNERLTRMGFEPRKEEIMTSGDVTCAFLTSHRAGKSVYLVGTEELCSQFRDAGIQLCTGEERLADIVVTSFDTSLTYAKLERACTYIYEGAEYLSTHPDFNCPTDTGIVPDSGAIAALVTAATGRYPRYFGKPYAETAAMISEKTGAALTDICIFGDRLYTDIALGRRSGVLSVLVLSGETGAKEAEEATGCDKPDLVYADLGEACSEAFGG